jgi:PAS domain S-box-containing protein
VHDLRNDLAVAIAYTEALIDGKLAPDASSFQDILAALHGVDNHVTAMRSAAREAADPDNERLLSAIVEGSPYAKVLVNEQGRITLVNAQTEHLFGYTRGELLGQPIELLVPERFRRGHPALRDAFQAAPVARPMGAGRDLYGRRKDGSEVAG